MSKIIITLDVEDVATLREVFHLALVQSEAVLEDYADDVDVSTPVVGIASALGAHNAVCALMARIDAMLPDSTGFFD